MKSKNSKSENLPDLLVKSYAKSAKLGLETKHALLAACVIYCGSLGEAAKFLDISPATAYRDWQDIQKA